MSDTKNGKQRNIYFSHHNALQGISSAIAHIERFSVYRKSLEGFISTRVSTRNKVLLRLRGFLHAFHLVEMTEWGGKKMELEVSFLFLFW